MELNVERTTSDAWIVVTVQGELDLSTASALRSELSGALEGGATHIVVDLLGVSFMDSTGLGVLMGTLLKLREREGDMRLVVEGGPVHRVLSLTGLTKVFAIFPSTDEAVRTG